ncbi:MAG: DMT family transporter [Gammaproteobacteria bacterium]
MNYNKIFSKRNAATAIGCLGLVMWAFSALLTTIVRELPIFEILSIVFTISVSITAFKLTIKKEWHKLKQPVLLWIIGVIGVYGNDVLYISAFKHAPSVQADLINYLWPILVILFAGCLPKEKFTIKHIVAGLLGFAGVYILITHGKGLAGFKMQYLWGYVLALLDAIVWALYTLVARHYNKKPVEMMGVYCGIGGLISFMLHMHMETTALPSIDQWVALIIMGFTTQGLAYFFWDYGVKGGNFKLLSVLSYGTPIASVALLVLFGVTKNSGNLMIACLLVTLSGVLGGMNLSALLTWMGKQLMEYQYYFKSLFTLSAPTK